jgi:hypothetical protein
LAALAVICVRYITRPPDDSSDRHGIRRLGDSFAVNLFCERIAIMRSNPMGWSTVLTKLGMRRQKRSRKGKHRDFRRNSRIEQLEPRQMLTVVTTDQGVVGSTPLHEFVVDVSNAAAATNTSHGGVAALYASASADTDAASEPPLRPAYAIADDQVESQQLFQMGRRKQSSA